MACRSVTCKALGLIFLSFVLLVNYQPVEASAILRNREQYPARERISLNEGWRFLRSTKNLDNLVYDGRPDTSGTSDRNNSRILKPWILPLANDFISNPAQHHTRPPGNPGSDLPFVQSDFDDTDWEVVNIPHDWAIEGPFYTEEEAIVDGGMGRLPVHGISWYRRTLESTAADTGKSIYLDIDGAMSYAMVWLNGNLVGGWPYGYNSFRLDLTPYLEPGDNQLAIRLDNPTDSSRWYPGGGIYRNIWLTKAESTHVAQWGTYISSRGVSTKSAILDLVVQVENRGNSSQQVEVITDVYELDLETGETGDKVAEFQDAKVLVEAGQKQAVNGSTMLEEPKLWGPLPTQSPNMYVAATQLYSGNQVIDIYETPFGVRSLVFDGKEGLVVNGEPLRIQGVNQHHDLGALGAAFNVRAAERQLEILQELGVNAIRMAHNPPAPELLDLTDRMGFIVMDEVFDCWEEGKTPNDFHLIFPDWHEADLRSFIRRDRNHPSIVAWSFGNEVGEQHRDEVGAEVARKLHDIVEEEDPTRPSTASMNYAKPHMQFPVELDVLSLNYQGEGVRDAPAYDGLEGITTPPQYDAFHDEFREKVLLGSETAAALSSRGTYLFPVTNETCAPVLDDTVGQGGDPVAMQVSAYELYTAEFGSSADKVFASQDAHPFVAGEFVWSGWDYLGEPEPYYSARSAYYGIIDLAGFKKDRYHLYQARWRSDLQTAHILPHWNWPDRVGKVTPVHVFSAADEAELLLNGESQGVRRKEESSYRFKWDDVIYEPGELEVVTYKNGTEWAINTVRTTGKATDLRLTPDRSSIKADGLDLSFITVEILDDEGDIVPDANNTISFSVSGPGEIVASDNGNQADMVSFSSKERNAFSGLALAIVRAQPGATGKIHVTASGKGLSEGQAVLEAA